MFLVYMGRKSPYIMVPIRGVKFTFETHAFMAGGADAPKPKTKKITPIVIVCRN